MERRGQTPVISIIVPVYKVEAYIRKCVDSILQQSYRHLDVILVDDGSPDLCGRICDEYAARDRRVRVVHKANGGLSSARNAGLAVAQGDYLGFVDSDDWVDPDMYAYLLDHALESGADITVCGRVEEYQGKSRRCCWTEPKLLDREQAMRALLEDDVMQSYAWNKLWKKEVFQGIRFPEGRNYEDIAVVHRAYNRADRVLCLPEAKYHYLQRRESIVRDVSLQNRMGYWASTRQRYDELKADWPRLVPVLEAQCAMAAANIWSICFVNSRAEREKVRPCLLEMSAFVREHKRSVYRSVSFGLTGRLTLRLVPYPAGWSFLLAYLLGAVSRWKHGSPV